MEIGQLLILIGTGALAGFINVNAGGGSTLTLPVLIFLGLDGAMANGTNRLAILIQNIAAIIGFQQDKLNEFKLSFKLAVITIPGAIIGALVAVNIEDEWFQRILGVIMIFIVFTLFIPKFKEQKTVSQQAEKGSWRVYLALTGIGFYGGFIQVGVGFLLMAALFHLLKLTLIKVNIHKVFIILIYNIPAFLLFILAGKVVWLYGLGLAAGNAIGGWVAARLSIRKGDRLIKVVLSMAIVIMAIKLVIQF